MTFATVIIRLTLLLVVTAIAVLIIAAIFRWVMLPALSALLIIIGSTVLFSAFSLFILLAVLTTLKSNLQSLNDYFSAPQRALRRFYWMQMRQIQLTQLFTQKINAITYRTALQKDRLLTNDNRKQIRTLSKAIARQLHTQQKRIDNTLFRQLQQELKRCQQQQNGAGLLQLQQRLMTIAHHD